eukprot:737231-Hanusia_phi.AAC.1
MISLPPGVIIRPPARGESEPGTAAVRHGIPRASRKMAQAVCHSPDRPSPTSHLLTRVSDCSPAGNFGSPLTRMQAFKSYCATGTVVAAVTGNQP